MFGIDDAAFATIAASALSAGSNMWGASQAASGAADANNMNYRMFKESQEFNERMFGSRHQMEVADLRKAGLNPVLSANTGGSVPGASYAPAINTKAQAASMLGSTAESATKVADVFNTARIGKEKARQEEINTKVREKTAGAEIAAAKAAAAQAVVNSAVAATRNDFNKSWFGQGSIMLNQLIRNIMGKESQK